jgi:nitrous oxidase accessory protein NosD
VRRLRRFSIALTAAAALAACTVSAASARALYVSPNGHDASGCSKLAPCQTIASAVAKAGRHDTVRVARGTYAESVTITKDIALVGAGRPLIDARGLTNGILITGGGARGAVVDGFTVENAVQEGILALRTSRVTITDNVVRFNDMGALVAHPTGECLAKGAAPGDCGEGLHLMTVNHATVTRNLVEDNNGGILLSDEYGPTEANLVAHNRALNNPYACGITLAGHNVHAVAGGRPTPHRGGVYGNRILDNTANGNGNKGQGGGILLGAGAPGSGVYSNLIEGNVANGNGLGGFTLHDHVAGQDFNGNQIIDNSFGHDALHGYASGAPGDVDPGITQTTGIIIFSDVTKLRGTVVRGNRLSGEYYGIWTMNVPRIKGSANTFAGSVTVAMLQI